MPMKKMRIIAFVTAICILLQVLSGCSFEKQMSIPENAKEYFSEGKVEGDLTYNAKGSFSVTLTADGASF